MWEKGLAEKIKLRTFRQEGSTGLSWWTQCIHNGPSKRTRRGQSEKGCDDGAEIKGQRRSEDAVPLTLKMKEGLQAVDSSGPLMLKEARKYVFAKSVQEECIPANIFISGLQKPKIINLCFLMPTILW